MKLCHQIQESYFPSIWFQMQIIRKERRKKKKKKKSLTVSFLTMPFLWQFDSTQFSLLVCLSFSLFGFLPPSVCLVWFVRPWLAITAEQPGLAQSGKLSFSPYGAEISNIQILMLLLLVNTKSQLLINTPKVSLFYLKAEKKEEKSQLNPLLIPSRSIISV